jgi:sugar lactone lactonase YvrE
VNVSELDVVEITDDLPEGFVEGARGTVVAVHGETSTVEFLDQDGHTIGLFELPVASLDVVERAGSRSFARDD